MKIKETHTTIHWRVLLKENKTYFDVIEAILCCYVTNTKDDVGTILIGIVRSIILL